MNANLFHASLPRLSRTFTGALPPGRSGRILVLTATVTLAFLARLSAGASSVAHETETAHAKWSLIERRFQGNPSQSLGDPNPFSVRLDITFTGPSGKRYVVPGFFDGDGAGGPDGDVWKVRFAADETGAWHYTTDSDEVQLHGHKGTFKVNPTPENATGFWKWGRLEYEGAAEKPTRYLKFRDGPWWLKAGCDDPENFLGDYLNYNTLEKRKAAINYLSARGINSLYVMTHNVGGDDNDVWPWAGRTVREARTHGAGEVRFDIARLTEWRELFEYMQNQGVVPYLVLEDDSAWSGYDHGRYYREIVARFGYLPALMFNLGEEHNENYSLAQVLEYARLLQALDPYDHPRGIHNVNRPDDRYIDAEEIDFTSIQTGSPGTRTGLENALEHNRIARDWIRKCKERGRRPLVVNFDEARPEGDRRCWWSVYLGGGVWETHVLQPYDRPFSAWEPMWIELGGARAFMESMPFWKMHPHNDLVREGRAFCLADPGKVYALYLPIGGAVVIDLPPGDKEVFTASWWNPSQGFDGSFRHSLTLAGGSQRLSAPGEGDWALRIVRK